MDEKDEHSHMKEYEDFFLHCAFIAMDVEKWANFFTGRLKTSIGRL